ncbi:hypothetical protein HZB04_02500 [Candidatus Wolfebacteria bacterium]|nr:hypothetical protein [Candidatus Wolfebacteria bacterium]
MIIQYHSRFKENLRKFPQYIRKKFYKQMEFLLRDIHHPSLRAKKYDESNNVWQAIVNVSVRFYFKIKNDVYFLLKIKKHPK